MKKILEKRENILTGLHGDVTGLTGNVSGLYGDVTGLTGDANLCELTTEERSKGINIQLLVK